MWTNANHRVASAAVAGAFLFSSYAAGVDLLPDEQFESHSSIVNLEGNHWSTANLNTASEVFANSYKGIGALGIGDVIRAAKLTLGLPNKDIAQIFGVTRQTLYSYSKGQGVERAANSQMRQRVFQFGPVIEGLDRIFSKSPGAMAKNYMIDGVTLFDLLVQEELDVEKVLDVAATLGSKLEKIPDSSSRPPVAGNLTLHDLTSHT
jgi:hypothetical protein